MFVHKIANGNRTGYNYFLKNDDGDYICSYGKEKPTFTYPRLYQGLEKGH